MLADVLGRNRRNNSRAINIFSRISTWLLCGHGGRSVQIWPCGKRLSSIIFGRRWQRGRRTVEQLRTAQTASLCEPSVLNTVANHLSEASRREACLWRLCAHKVDTPLRHQPRKLHKHGFDGPHFIQVSISPLFVIRLKLTK